MSRLSEIGASLIAAAFIVTQPRPPAGTTRRWTTLYLTGGGAISFDELPLLLMPDHGGTLSKYMLVDLP